MLLNQWLVSLFGVDPLMGQELHGRKVEPFHVLADIVKHNLPEGLDSDNLHFFYHALANSNLLRRGLCSLSREQILGYEENIVRHTLAINEKRHRPVVWKYFQWFTLLFVEVYLDQFFGNSEKLQNDLNVFVDKFNRRWNKYGDIPLYDEDDLNKLCLQNATGSGKTLLMHINLLQYRHYAVRHGKDNDLSRVILLTPNERLSEQHIAEFQESGISSRSYLQSRGGLISVFKGLEHVDVLEITKLTEEEGPNTIATRSLGDQNLLLVDEGHRGMSGTEKGVWFTRRSELCAKGFAFEYSATFEQAVRASRNLEFENSYAKTVIFDYSYRWFYEDGFGKDYHILNIPESFKEIQFVYMTACLLKFYQQLRIYEERTKDFDLFNLAKPLWVFVGSTVASIKSLKKTKGKIFHVVNPTASDVAKVIVFVADFLNSRPTATRRMREILIGDGQDTGLLDKDDNDIFADAFIYLARVMSNGETVEELYRDILVRLFNHTEGGHLLLDRIRGKSGEVALRVGTSETPFGLINVGDAKGLCDHVAEVAEQNDIHLTLSESDFNETLFNSVKDSNSPVNLLIGSKKFVEGWDCWRVSTLGLMHVGRSEGSQIIQLFGRGVRLKGYEWSLKRSGHSDALVRPDFIEELETLNVFGIEADFMEKFRDFLKEQGLPGNERRAIYTIPLNVTYDFGKNLKILRPKRKASDGKEYDFKKDAPVPTLGNVPNYILRNPVVADWYPRIQSNRSKGVARSTVKHEVSLSEQHLALLNYDTLFFELEQFKYERSWYNLNITKRGIKTLLQNRNWYTLYLPKARLTPQSFGDVFLLQQVATELLKRYCKHYYNYCKRAYIEPRLELRELTPDDDNIPHEEFYQFIVDSDEQQLILEIKQMIRLLDENADALPNLGDLKVCNFGKHLFQPLFHIRRGGKITNRPVALNESEYKFVTDLKFWYDCNKSTLEEDGTEIYLLRNLSRGKGVGFFEAGNFHPDFILWMLVGQKQYITFVEPHGLMHESASSEKILFYKRIKDVECRLKNPTVTLNSFILSWTPYTQLNWGKSRDELEDMHVLFMKEGGNKYIDKLFCRLRGKWNERT